MSIILAITGPSDVRVHLEIEGQGYNPDVLDDIQTRLMKTYDEAYEILAKHFVVLPDSEDDDEDGDDDGDD